MSPKPTPNTLDGIQKEALKNPHAFIASDGRVLYRYTEKREGSDFEDEYIFSKPIEEVTQQDFIDMPINLADLTAGRLPNNLYLEFIDPQWAGHWFYKRGEGRRIGQALADGYVPVKKEDLKNWHYGVNDKDGSIEQFDLVAMKIHKAKLFKKVAEYVHRAKLQGGIEGYRNKAISTLSPANRENVHYYHAKQALEETQGLGPVVSMPNS